MAQVFSSKKGEFIDHADTIWAWIFDNVFDQTQCRELINMANEKGFVTALVGKAGSDLEDDPSVRGWRAWRCNGISRMLESPARCRFRTKAVDCRLAPLGCPARAHTGY